MDVVHSQLKYFNFIDIHKYFYIQCGEFAKVTIFLFINCSLGLYQWSDKVVRKVERLWDVRDNKIVPHTVYLLVTPRVVVSITEFINVS